jgi:hypothetical protein
VDAVVVVASGMGGRRQPAAKKADGETAAAVANTTVGVVCPRCGAQLRESPCACPSETEAAVDTLAPAAPGPEAATAMVIDAGLTATAGPVAPPAARRARAPPAWLEAQRCSEADLPPEVLSAEKRRHARGRSRAHKPEDAEPAAATTDAAPEQLVGAGVPVKPRSSAARRKAPSRLEAVGAPAEAQHVAEQTQGAASGAQVDAGSVPPVAKKARRDDRKNHHKKPSTVADGDGAPAVETAEVTLPDATAGADASALPSEADKSGKKRSTSVRKPRQDAPVVPAIVPSVDAPRKAPRRAAAVAADKAREDAAKLRESSKRRHDGDGVPNNCAPPATVPAPAHALIAPQTGYVYNKVSVLRSQDSPLGVMCMDLGGLFLAAVSTRNLYTRRKPAAGAAKAEETHGGNAKDATAEVLHPPAGDAAPCLFDDVDPDVAQAWRDLQHLLPSTDAGRHPRAVVSSPAFVSCLQDFQRLLGAGMWDPNKVNGGGSARMGAHFGRLLTEPSISVAAWSAQRPDLGSRSRGRRPTH